MQILDLLREINLVLVESDFEIILQSLILKLIDKENI